MKLRASNAGITSTFFLLFAPVHSADESLHSSSCLQKLGHRLVILSALIVSALAYGTVHAAPSAERCSESSVEPAVNKAPNLNISYPDYDAIIVCIAENCRGTCDIIALSGLDLNTCYYQAINFESIIPYSPNGGTWNLTIFAALSDCTDPLSSRT
ncbi:hypothetical protein SCP_0311330 [Sparassis crispa]|uniref:Uncharacterized protein n=1 Tax=Sparassis crispa TaxID=139825 RepID=A0A401GGT0_9APHY|nr:hypothetical protein SCP_0311330 [Sparassis crispa]GBE81404.1 hypothetical protein SCP_0311330 [Sparassis crispa]